MVKITMMIVLIDALCVTGRRYLSEEVVVATTEIFHPSYSWGHSAQWKEKPLVICLQKLFVSLTKYLCICISEA